MFQQDASRIAGVDSVVHLGAGEASKVSLNAPLCFPAKETKSEVSAQCLWKTDRQRVIGSGRSPEEAKRVNDLRISFGDSLAGEQLGAEDGSGSRGQCPYMSKGRARR